MFLIYKLKKYLQGFCFLCTFVASLLKSGFNKKNISIICILLF